MILLDEVELIGRYTTLQRAKSYAEIARWVKGERDDPGAPICAVLTTVDDFETQVLVGKNDRELIPNRLRAKGTDEDELLAGLAESGMRIIGHEQIALQPPGREELDRTYAKLKQIHSEAYGWDPPDVAGHRAAALQPHAPVRAGLDQRVGPAPARPRLPSRRSAPPDWRWTSAPTPTSRGLTRID